MTSRPFDEDLWQSLSADQAAPGAVVQGQAAPGAVVQGGDGGSRARHHHQSNHNQLSLVVNFSRER